jgi:hypothetical protein
MVMVAYPTPWSMGTSCPIMVRPPVPRYWPAATSYNRYNSKIIIDFTTGAKLMPALIEKKIKVFSCIRKFRMAQLPPHKWGNIRKPFLIYDFATSPL